jgi:hypothetical protein
MQGGYIPVLKMTRNAKNRLSQGTLQIIYQKSDIYEDKHSYVK